jgi:ribonuclease HII
MAETVEEIRAMLRAADADEFAALERSLKADSRKGVRSAIEVARRRIAAEQAEAKRLAQLYAFDRSFIADLPDGIVVGLDEVGRGSVAGPLAVGAVVLAADACIAGLNDSKQLTPEQREEIATQIKENALCWAVHYVEPAKIDGQGMSASLREAFAGALAEIERAGVHPDVVLLDGNPLGIDKRETNVVKGDAKSASIAAASIVAKVSRDALMCDLDSTFPQYGFSDNKGYASPEHIEAIRTYGLSSVHRASFCKSFLQETLF